MTACLATGQVACEAALPATEGKGVESTTEVSCPREVRNKCFELHSTGEITSAPYSSVFRVTASIRLRLLTLTFPSPMKAISNESPSRLSKNPLSNSLRSHRTDPSFIVISITGPCPSRSTNKKTREETRAPVPGVFFNGQIGRVNGATPEISWLGSAPSRVPLPKLGPAASFSCLYFLGDKNPVLGLDGIQMLRMRR
jgi:hypothetical protein